MVSRARQELARMKVTLEALGKALAEEGPELADRFAMQAEKIGRWLTSFEQASTAKKGEQLDYNPFRSMSKTYIYRHKLMDGLAMRVLRKLQHSNFSQPH